MTKSTGHLPLKSVLARLRGAPGSVSEGSSGHGTPSQHLTPSIAIIGDGVASAEATCSAADLAGLHNEPLAASRYPLALAKGEYFSETIDPGVPDAPRYREWIEDCLGAIQRSSDPGGVIDVSQLDDLGHQIQRIDSTFAERNVVGHSPDFFHGIHGPNAQHPYSKLTLCRTRFPVRVNGSDMPFLYEKYLVSYSYIDTDGTRRCTTTPIHSHPFNHEVSYFLQWGAASRAIEEEFVLVAEADAPNYPRNGALHLHPKVKARHEIVPAPTPIHALDHFTNDKSLFLAGSIVSSDGLFRPHRVQVVDDPVRGTLYYAINNYWSPTGRVFLFDHKGSSQPWRHSNWT